MHSLTKDERAKARVCYAVLVVALIMQRVNEQVGLDTDQPAIQQCTALIDDLLNPMPEERRSLILRRIQRERLRFYKQVESMDSASCLVGAIQILIGDRFKSKLGTRFDFIRQTFRSNLPLVKERLPYSKDTARMFRINFSVSIFRV